MYISEPVELPLNDSSPFSSFLFIFIIGGNLKMISDLKFKF